MAKDKKGSKAAAPAVKPTASKPVESVKAGRVTKPAEQAKSVAKEAAKKTAKVVEKSSKKSKKEPEPVDDTSDSSASSDDESEDEVEAPVKVNGHAKAAATKQDDSDDDSESDAESDDASDSEEEVATAKTAAPKTNGAVKVDEDDDDDDDDDSSSADDEEDEEDDSDSDSDAEIDAKAGAHGGVADTEMKDDDDSSDASDSEEEEEEKPKVAEKKRKAEDSSDQVPKKSKVMVNGEQKDPVSNLFVGNLSWNIDEEWLTREFEDFGELKSVRIITDRDSGRSKGFGYVEFVSVNSAITAVEEKSGELVDGREIRIDFSAPRPPRDFNDQTPKQRGNDRASKYGDTPNEPSSTLFVGNVSFRADESVLTEVFQEYGTINAVRLPTDRESGELKGFGYVEFSSIDEAKGAFEALNGQDIAGRAIRLDYSKPRDPNSSPRGGFGGRGGGGFDRGRGGRGGRGGFNDRGRGRGGARGGRGVTTNRGGFGDFSGRKTTF